MLSTKDIATLIKEDIASERKRQARIGRKYYDGEHDILSYKLYYYDADGNLVEDTTRSNIKISHPFFTELVDQAVQYMLSGDEPFVKSDDQKLQEQLDSYFGDDFKAELAESLTDACTGGWGYMYGYRNSDNRTTFTYADAMGVVEVRAKDTDDKTEYVIYWYIDRIEKGQKKIKRIQVWDKAQTTYFVQVDDGKVIKATDEPLNPRPHIIYEADEEGCEYDSLGYIPFFKLESSRKQTSHLAPIKALIDDYDLMACGLSNNLQDVSEGLYVVRGFQGDNLEELIQNVKVKKHIGVEAEGDVDVKTVDVPYLARQAKLEIDETNIYRFGMGFNASQIGDGNITNVVIRSRYALLDLKCNKLEIRLRAFLKKLVKIALQEINDEEGTAYKPSDVYLEFERNIMTNAVDNAQIEKAEAEVQQLRVNTLLNAAAYLDQETILEALCNLLDLDFDELKDLLPGKGTDLNAASEKLLQLMQNGDSNALVTEGAEKGPGP